MVRPAQGKQQENGTENPSYYVLEADVTNEPNPNTIRRLLKIFVVIKHSLFRFLFGLFDISWFGNKLS